MKPFVFLFEFLEAKEDSLKVKKLANEYNKGSKEAVSTSTFKYNSKET